MKISQDVVFALLLLVGGALLIRERKDWALHWEKKQPEYHLQNRMSKKGTEIACLVAGFGAVLWAIWSLYSLF